MISNMPPSPFIDLPISPEDLHQPVTHTESEVGQTLEACLWGVRKPVRKQTAPVLKWWDSRVVFFKQLILNE